MILKKTCRLKEDAFINSQYYGKKGRELTDLHDQLLLRKISREYLESMSS